jgi:hypothetical protein
MKKPKINRYEGFLFISNEISTPIHSDIHNEINLLKDEYDPLVLRHCRIIKDFSKESDKLIFFDINMEGYYNQDFVGYFYNDGKFLGRTKYNREANLPDEIFNGVDLGGCGLWSCGGAASSRGE